MKQWEGKLFKLLGAIFVLLVVALVLLATRSATQRMIASLPTPTGYEAEFFALRLIAADLPSGYQGQKIPDLVKVENGIGQEYIFWLQTRSTSYSLSHRIIIFETSALAETAFKQQLTEQHQTISSVNEGLGSADDKLYATNIAWGCDQPVKRSTSVAIIRTQYCMTIATYQNVYVEISGQTFTDEYLTMEKYFALVKRLDQRAGEVLKISKPE